MPARTRKPAPTILVWDDDPLAVGAVPAERPAPKMPGGRLKVPIDPAGPPAGLYEPGTPEFRWWAAADALQRGVAFWSSVLPKGTSWQRGTSLPVRLDAGDKLNAFYNRQSLTFFHASVGGTTIFTGESPDVVVHEMGHAVLDAIRPQLWDAMSHEVAAFHESFGDMSAMLVGLQLPALRQQVVAETSGLYRTSRLSRVAEQLGWAIRQRQPCGVDSDCLRNAVNCFFYQPAAQLPIRSSSCVLSSEPHSYSRVFSAGFLETLTGMGLTLGRPITPDILFEASHDLARLLVAAVQAAPVVPAYMSEVAAHVLEADASMFGGKYAAAIENGFLSRGLLSTSGVAMAPRPGLRVAAATPLESRMRGRARSADLPTMTVSAQEFGLGDRPLVLQLAGEPRRLTVSATGLDGGPAPAPAAEDAAKGFLNELLVRGRVQLPGRPLEDDVRSPQTRLRTHAIVEQGDALVVARRLFE